MASDDTAAAAAAAQAPAARSHGYLAGSGIDSPSTPRVGTDTATGGAKPQGRDEPLSAWQEHDVAEDSRRGCPVLHPDHVYRKRWDMAQVIALVYVAILVPARTGFSIDLELGTWEWILELCVDVYFICDIFVNFRTGFFDDGVVEMRPKRIARSYAKQWLAVDVISTLPISYITLIIASLTDDGKSAGRGNTTKLFKILRLLRLAKLLRLGRLKKIIKRHEEEFENLMGVFKVGSSILAMGYTCHLVACGWYFIGEDVIPAVGLNPQPGWISGQMNDVWNVTQDRDEVGFATRYITSYYWAITTISTVGFGDITGKTDAERVYSIIAEMFGCLMFAVLIGSLGSMMVGQKLLEEKVDKQLCELREFMEAKGIPKELRVKIRRYMETLYVSKSGFDESEVLSQLPPAMAHELLSHMYQQILSQVPMFNNLEEGAILRLCALIKPFKTMSGDLIYKHGEIGREIYIIIDGNVEISYTVEHDDSLQEVKTLHAGATFGEGCASELFEMDREDEEEIREVYKREDTAIAHCDCDLKFLTLDNLRDVCSDFPSVRAEFWLLVEMFHRNRLSAQMHHWNESQRAAGEGGTSVSATTVEIAEKMEKKLLQRMERHSKHPIAELAESKKSSAEAGDAKDKASGATATTTVSPGAAPGGTNGAAPLPGLLIPPMDSQPSSSTRGEAISGGSRDVSSTDTGSSFVSGRSRSKTMIPPVKQSPGFKQSTSSTRLGQNTDLQVLNSSVARLEGRMGKLEAVVEKKMDSILTLMQLQLDGQAMEKTKEQQELHEPSAPQEP